RHRGRPHLPYWIGQQESKGRRPDYGGWHGLSATLAHSDAPFSVEITLENLVIRDTLSNTQRLCLGLVAFTRFRHTHSAWLRFIPRCAARHGALLFPGRGRESAAEQICARFVPEHC